MAGASSSAVLLAIIGNGILTVIKFVAFVLSGSGAMMSEAVHSFADTANQTLLYVGVKKSLKPADEDFHYGYGADRFVFALLSAMGIFVLGCGVTVYHGIHSLSHPPDLSVSWITFAVLGVSFVVDGLVLMVAVRAVRSSKGDKGFFEFVRTSTDPTLLAVLFEDFIATFGVLVALAGIIAAWVTGNPIYDALSSITIGAMLGIMAIWLGVRNRRLILGPAIPPKILERVIAHLREVPSIQSVREVRTRIVGSDRFRLAAEVDYNGRYLAKRFGPWLRDRMAQEDNPDDAAWDRIAADFGEMLLNELGDEVDRIEAGIGAKFPEIHHVDLEAD